MSAFLGQRHGGARTQPHSAVRAPPLVMLPTTVATQRGVYSHTRLLIPSYTGALCQLAKNSGASTQDFFPNAHGMLDVAAVTAWAAGSVIRVSKVYNQGTQVGADAAQSTDSLRPILHPANIQPDGLWPAAFMGFSGPSGDSSPSLVIGSTLTHNRGNHSQVVVCEPLTNVGISTGTGQCAVQGMTQANGADRVDIQLGDSDFANRYGLGGVWGATPTKKFNSLYVPDDRVVLMESQSTANTIDGVASPNLNLRVNASNWSTSNTGQTTNSTNSARIGAGAGGTNGGMRWYASMFFANHLGVAGQRELVTNSLVSAFGVNTGFDAQVAMFGSSTQVGYRSRTNGAPFQIRELLVGSPRVEAYSMAGTAMQTLTTNKALLSSARDPNATQNIAFVYNIRNDIDAGAAGSTAYNSYIVPFVQQLVSDGWDHVFVGTQLYTTYTTNLAAKTAELDACRLLIINATNQATYGYTAIDTNQLTHLTNYADTTYFDSDQIHMNETGIAIFAAAVAGAVNAVL